MNNLEAANILNSRCNECELTSSVFNTFDNIMKSLDLNPEFQEKYKFYRERFKKDSSGRYNMVRWTKYIFLRHLEFLKDFVKDNEKNLATLEIGCGTGVGLYIMKNLYKFEDINGIDQVDQGIIEENLLKYSELISEFGSPDPSSDFWKDIRIALGVDDICKIETLTSDSLIQSFKDENALIDKKFNLIYALGCPVLAHTQNEAESLINSWSDSLMLNGKLILAFNDEAWEEASFIKNEIIIQGGTSNEARKVLILSKK